MPFLFLAGTNDNNEVVVGQFTTIYHVVHEHHKPPITDLDIRCHSYVDMSIGKQFNINTNPAYNAYTDESTEPSQLEYEYVRSPISVRQIDISMHTEDETNINYHYYI